MNLLVIVLLTILSQSLTFADLKVVAHPETFQGRSFIVFITNSSEVSSAELTFKNKSFKFYPYENGLRAIIPTEPESKTGIFPFKIAAVMANSKTGSHDSSVLISPIKYPKASFWVKPSKKGLITSGVMAKEWARIEKVLINESPVKLWSGFFKKPVPGITTMPFGTREFVNGKPSGRHRGWDMRAKIGTKVLAPNSGTVVFAEFLKAFGGTVVLDHGQGLNTLYFHLSKIFAMSGQSVETGDVLGLSGNSGISSGPHLHWSMSVHNVRVEPKQWVTTVMP